MKRRPVDVVPQPFVRIFASYDFFNEIQSALIDDLLNSDKSLVLSAPTGSGKTAAFELSIVRMLQQNQNILNEILPKCIYIAPIKALCNEKFIDWKQRFDSLGVTCVQLTGDTESSSLTDIREAQIVITTPEKWDSMTRRWLDFEQLVRAVQLFIVDEVHLINEDQRGPILETIVARMKTTGVKRFVVASATIPNAEDLATWIRGGSAGLQVVQHVFDAKQRPVPLEKHVIGINLKLGGFQFDMRLNYRLPEILRKYSENKASLVFCNSRKSTEMAAFNLNKVSSVFVLSENQKSYLKQTATRLTDVKLRKVFINGIAYHHAGLQYEDRNLIEASFRQGCLMVLISTSTLAMGINLPVHLVVIKSTEAYACGKYSEYPENMILQMIGRAGRPQYDTKGVAVILTRQKNVKNYQKLLSGSAPIESHLHKHLAEHLNSEIALKTITSLEEGMNWLRGTYLYIRAVCNPKHYGFDENLTKDFVEHKLEELCLGQIIALRDAGLVKFNPLTGTKVTTTAYGFLMARYYLSCETMQIFQQLNGKDTLESLLKVLAKSKEMSEFSLRVSEKKDLNNLNKTPVRFPIKGRISNHEEKIVCIIQAVLGNIDITTPYLIQESLKIMRTGNRISKCLLEYTLLRAKEAMRSNKANWYESMLNAVILAKCFQAKIWENSEFAAKQLHGIGTVYSNALAKLGKTTLKSIANTEARTIENLLNKSAPFGDDVLKQLMSFPEYELKLERQSNCSIRAFVKQVNDAYVYKNDASAVLILGDSLNDLLLIEENLNAIIYEFGCYESVLKLQVAEKVEYVYGHVIHLSLVGVDAYAALEINAPTAICCGATSKPKTKQSHLNFSLNDSFFDNTLLSDSRLNLDEILIDKTDSFASLNSLDRAKIIEPTIREKSKKHNVSLQNKTSFQQLNELENYRFQKSKPMNIIWNLTCSGINFNETHGENCTVDGTTSKPNNKATQLKLTDYFSLSKKGKQQVQKFQHHVVPNKYNDGSSKKQKPDIKDQTITKSQELEKSHSDDLNKQSNVSISKLTKVSIESSSSENMQLTMIPNPKKSKLASIPPLNSEEINIKNSTEIGSFMTLDSFLFDPIQKRNDKMFHFPDLTTTIEKTVDSSLFEQKLSPQKTAFFTGLTKNLSSTVVSQNDFITESFVRALEGSHNATRSLNCKYPLDTVCIPAPCLQSEVRNLVQNYTGDKYSLSKAKLEITGDNGEEIYDWNSKQRLQPAFKVTDKFESTNKRKRENNSFVQLDLTNKLRHTNSLLECSLTNSSETRISPLDLSKTANTINLQKKNLTSKQNKGTQTNFHSKYEKNRKQTPISEHDFELWHKVALQFRETSRDQAQSLASFIKVFKDVRSQQIRGQKQQKILNLKQNSTFRLKLFNNDNSNNSNKLDRYQIKLKNQNVMNFVLKEKCDKNTIKQQREIEFEDWPLDLEGLED